MTSTVLNGNAYSDDGSQSRDMRNGGYRNWLIPMMADAVVEINIAKNAQTYANAAAISASQAANYAAGLRATSTTSLSVGAGSKSLTIEINKQFSAGQFIILNRASIPATYMWGTVASYNSSTGALVLDVIYFNGSGTFTDWQISVSGAQGAQGASTRSYIRSKSSAYTVVLNDLGCIIDCTGTFTLSLTAANTLGDGFYVWIRNSGSGIITIDPNSAETIDGVAVSTLVSGNYVLLQCNGSAWTTVVSSLKGLSKLPILSDTSGKTALSSMELIDSLVSTGIGNTIGPIIWTGSLFVAAAFSSAANCATSPTWQTWTLRSLPASMAAACMAAIGSTVVLIQTGTTAAARSTDGGVTWSSMTLPVATSSPSIGVVNGLFVLAHTTASGTAYYTSPDGSAWTSRTFPATGAWAVSVETCGGLLFATATLSPTTTYYTTPDGINWTSRTLTASATGRFHAQGKRQVDGSYLYPTASGLYSSTDGISWSLLSSTAPSTSYSPIKFRGAWLMLTGTTTVYTAGAVAGAWTPRTQSADFGLSEGRYAVDHTGGNIVSTPFTANGNVATINASTPTVYGLFGD